MTENLIHWEDVTIMNVYAISKYRRQKLIEWKGETEKYTVVVDYFNFSLSAISTISEQHNEKIYRRLE